MGKNTFEDNGCYFIDGVAYMDCKITGEPVKNVSTEAVSVIGSTAVLGMVGMPKERPQRVSTGRPAGWHFMNEFVDKDGNVFHKGKEQPKLKGTLPPLKLHQRRKLNVGLKNRFFLIDKKKRKRLLKKLLRSRKIF